MLQGDLTQASRGLNAFYSVWREWGYLPEQMEYDEWKLDNVVGVVSTEDRGV